MKITQKDLIGEIKDFPIEVVQKMIERQVEQGNKADVTVFQRYATSDFIDGGFVWDDTTEGEGFWTEVISHKNFDVFFAKYPKAEEDYWIDPKGRRMLVWYGEERENCAEERIVIAKLPSELVDPYVAVNKGYEDKFKKGEKYDVLHWAYAKPIPQKTKLSLSTIAEKFGLSVDEIEIYFDK